MCSVACPCHATTGVSPTELTAYIATRVCLIRCFFRRLREFITSNICFTKVHYSKNWTSSAGVRERKKERKPTLMESIYFVELEQHNWQCSHAHLTCSGILPKLYCNCLDIWIIRPNTYIMKWWYCNTRVQCYNKTATTTNKRQCSSIQTNIQRNIVLVTMSNTLRYILVLGRSQQKSA